MSPTCSLSCGCHGKGRCLATVHWTFTSYGRLEAERMNQIWWNLVHNSKFGTQLSHDEIWKFFRFKKIVRSTRLNKKSFDFDEIWASGSRMCEPISLKFWRSNFTMPLLVCIGRLPWRRSLRSSSAAFSVPGRQNYGSHFAPPPHTLWTGFHITAVA